MSRLGKKIQISACVFTLSLKLEKWSFHVAGLPRTGKKCTEIIKALEGRAKVIFVHKICKICGVVAAVRSYILNSLLLITHGGYAEVTNLKVICPVVIYSTNKNIVVFHHFKIPLAIRFSWKQQPRNSECDPSRNVLHLDFEKELIGFIVVIPVGCVLVSL